MAGITKSNSSIAHNGHDNTFNGDWDAFLVKFTLLGIRQWGTYYGGSGAEHYNKVTVSKNADVYLSGMTYSQTGIATNNGYDATHNGGYQDGYLVRFNQQGQRQWGTYYGGPKSESIIDLTTDISANVYLAGKSSSEEGIAHNGFQEEKSSGGDAFLVKLHPYQTTELSDGPGDYTDFNDPSDSPSIKDNISTRNGRLSAEAGATPKVSIYPNPATETLQIQIGNSSDATAYLEVFTMAGQKVYNARLDQSSTLSIDVRQWSKGMYILKTHTASGTSSEKVLIQ